MPKPAAGITAFRILLMVTSIVFRLHSVCQFDMMKIRMKRMLFLALILIFFFQVVFPTSVLAEETQSIFENTDTSQDQGNPHSFATMRLTPFQSVLGALGTPFNWSIVGNVIPSVSSEDEKNFTDLTPFVDHFTSPMSWLVPGYFTLTKPYIPFTTGQPSRYHYCAILLI